LQVDIRELGGDDTVILTGTMPPDQIEIGRGTCGRVSVVS
jgi:hypothetical protein